MLQQGMGRLMLSRMGKQKGLDDAAGNVEAEGTDTAGPQPAVSVSCVANAQDELRCTSTLVVSGPTSAQLQGSWTRLLWLVQVILGVSEDGDPTSSLLPSQSLAALLLSVCFQASSQGLQHHNLSPPSIQRPLEQNPTPRLHAWWVQGCCPAIRSTAMTCSSFAGTCFE